MAIKTIDIRVVGNKQMVRRFRFSLRTALILLTLACVAATLPAYKFNWIRQRHAFPHTLNTEPDKHIAAKLNCAASMSPPGLLIVFGEGAIPAFEIDEANANPQDVKRLKALFPESTIRPISR